MQGTISSGETPDRKTKHSPIITMSSHLSLECHMMHIFFEPQMLGKVVNEHLIFPFSLGRIRLKLADTRSSLYFFLWRNRQKQPLVYLCDCTCFGY